MSDTDTPTDSPDNSEVRNSETAVDEDHDSNATPEGSDPESDPDVFPREVVEDLRRENGKYRQRAQQHARRLHTELVRATGRLADPTDLEFDEAHLEDPDALNAAMDDLLTRKPHLASRTPLGDIGQGRRGSTATPLGLLDLLKQHT